MHIKLAIVDNDVVYLERFTSKMSSQYKSEISIESFSNVEMFFDLASHRAFDILWVSEEIDIPDAYENSEMIVYMVNNKKITSVKGNKAIAKYQNINDIYTQLSEYAATLEKNYKYEFANQNAESTSTIMVTGVSGGVGTSLYATALAQRLHEAGKKVLHIDLNHYSNIAMYNDDDNEVGLDETFKLIKNYVIKGEDMDISSELKKMLSKDISEIEFIKPFRSLFKSFETKPEDIKVLIEKLVTLKQHDYIIVEKPLVINRTELFDLNQFDKIILVSDNSDKCERNIQQIVDAIDFFDQKNKNAEVSLISKMLLAYNRMKLPRTEKSLLRVESTHRDIRGKDDHAIVQEIKEKINVEGLMW